MMEMKPCPYCGSEVEVIEDSSTYVECPKCLMCGPAIDNVFNETEQDYEKTKVEAIEAWNSLPRSN